MQAFSQNKISPFAKASVDSIVIRCSSTSLKFANTGKKTILREFLNLYGDAVRFFVKQYWLEEPKMKFADRVVFDSPLSFRAKQSAANQALAIVRGTRKKNKKRAFVIERLTKEGKLKQAQKLQEIQDSATVSEPVLENINAELSASLAVFCPKHTAKEFDLWIKLKSLGISKPIVIPLRKHKQFNKLSQNGSVRPSIRLTKDSIVFFFESQPPANKSVSVLGVDIGSRHTISASDGQQAQRDNHGWVLNEIQKRLAGRKKGSKGFRRTQAQRDNFIRWSVNQLNFTGVGEVRLEDLKGMRKGRKLNRFLQGWNYRYIIDTVKKKCEERGVRVTSVPNQYTSQRCSECGWVSKDNRKAEAFLCGDCGFVCDADKNAARNIALGGAYSPSVPKNASVARLHTLPSFAQLFPSTDGRPILTSPVFGM